MKKPYKTYETIADDGDVIVVIPFSLDRSFSEDYNETERRLDAEYGVIENTEPPSTLSKWISLFQQKFSSSSQNIVEPTFVIEDDSDQPQETDAVSLTGAKASLLSWWSIFVGSRKQSDSETCQTDTDNYNEDVEVVFIDRSDDTRDAQAL